MLKFTVSLNRSDPQEMMRRWRCLILVIRGRLVEVQDGISTMDEAFLPYVVVNEQGATVWETIKDTLPVVGAGRRPVLAGR